MNGHSDVPAGIEDALLASLLSEAGFAASGDDAIRPRQRERETDAPLSAQQRRLWFLSQLDPASSLSYVIPGAVRVRGRLDLGLLKHAIEGLVRRHESLRTVIAVRDGVPRQTVRGTQPLDLIVEQIEDAGDRDCERLLTDRVLDALSRPFDLESGPVLRVFVLRVTPEDHLVLIAMHHIVSDGWSVGVMIREIVELYAAGSVGRPPALAPLQVQYADFAIWQDEWRAGSEASAQLAFWKRQLRDLPQLELPLERPRPAVLTHRGGAVRATFGEQATGATRRLSQACGSTLFMTLLSAFAVLLHRYTGQDALAIGTPSANRNRAELEPLIGFFVNALVLRADLSGGPSFRVLIERMKQVSLDAWAHQDLPFEDVVEALQPDRSQSRNPLFQAMFVLQNAPAGRLEIPGLAFEPVDVPSTTAKFDLTLYVVETGDSLSLLLEYNRDLFTEAAAARMLVHYEQLLTAAVGSPDVPVIDLPMLSAAERERVIVRWNATGTPYPRDASLAELFHEQATRTPDAVAVRFGSASMTYLELDRRSNQLAHRLRSHGAGRETMIGFLFERSLEMVVGLLGILKAGGAYLPLDPAYPFERLAMLLGDAAVRLVVAQSTLLASFPHDQLDVISLDPSWTDIDTGRSEPLVPVSGPMDLAYVMFTSGSTGMPKGVEVPQRAVVRLVRGTDYVSFAGETILQAAPLTFDASTFEIWGALLNGGTLAILAPGAPSLAELGRGIVAAGVTTAWLTAGLFHQMVDHELSSLRGLRQLVAGGDVLSARHIRALLDAAPHLRIVNGFGPTETTTFACCHPMRAETGPSANDYTVPIGGPIGNTQAYVLDARLAPVPVGVAGELYLGGDGVARGYLGRPALTAERFIPDPFGSAPGNRLYQTGDRVRWLPAGTLEFLGRRDRQVKVRGFRVEAGEIEAVLAAHPDLRAAAVTAPRDEAGDRELVAYVVADDGPGVTPEALRLFLRRRLPDHMVPSLFVRVDALPLTINGKVDLAALPAARRDQSTREFAAPRTPDESAVAEIWQDVLHLDRVGMDDNFFELGGHSLLATQVVARLRDRLGVEIPLAAVFTGPTVESLALEVGRVRSMSAPPSGAIQSIPRSSARRRAGGGGVPTPC